DALIQIQPPREHARRLFCFLTRTGLRQLIPGAAVLEPNVPCRIPPVETAAACEASWIAGRFNMCTVSHEFPSLEHVNRSPLYPWPLARSGRRVHVLRDRAKQDRSARLPI